MQKILVQRVLLLSVVTVFVFSLTAIFAVLHHEDGDDQIRFNLTNQFGEPVSEKDFQDDFLIVFFGFTNCPSVCPTQMTLITQLLKNISQANKTTSIQPLFISVDPQRDTPAVIQHYLDNFDEKFIGLSGSETAIQQAALSFKARLPQTMNTEPLLNHSTVIYLVSPDGRLIDFIPANASLSIATEIFYKGLNKWNQALKLAQQA